jgi:hypothetical protein
VCALPCSRRVRVALVVYVAITNEMQMHNRCSADFSTGPSLPAGWLLAIPAARCATADKAIAPLAYAVAPPDRLDLETDLPIPAEYLEAQARAVRDEMTRCPPPASPTGPIDIEHATMIGLYTVDGPIYSAMNAWGFHAGRNVRDMAPVAPAYKLLLQALYACDHLLYRGPAVRILDASRPDTRMAHLYAKYKAELAPGAAINFHGFASFGRDETQLDAFVGGATKPLIVLKCDNVVGYDISSFSMVLRNGGADEQEVLVPCPSYFVVTSPPLKIRNAVVVAVRYDEGLSVQRRFLPTASPQADTPSSGVHSNPPPHVTHPGAIPQQQQSFYGVGMAQMPQQPPAQPYYAPSQSAPVPAAKNADRAKCANRACSGYSYNGQWGQYCCTVCAFAPTQPSQSAPASAGPAKCANRACSGLSYNGQWGQYCCTVCALAAKGTCRK